MNAISREEKSLSLEYKTARKDLQSSKMVENFYGRGLTVCEFHLGIVVEGMNDGLKTTERHVWQSLFCACNWWQCFLHIH